MTINQEIDAGNLVIKINGAIAIGGGFFIDTQMDNADDQVSFLLLQTVDSELGTGIKVIKGRKGYFLDQAGIDLRCSFRSFHAKEAKLHTAGCFDHGGRIKNGFAGFIQIDICADDFEFGRFQVLHQLCIAEVKFMVAECNQVIAGCVHHGDRACTFETADVGGALAEVSGVNHDNLSTGVFVAVLQRSHICVTAASAVDVVGVQDYGFSAEIIVNDFCIGCIVIVC